ncbi:DUF1501 domain-containing protein [Fischerella sp. JS2]|uniref:DUF1501 domain-containing protein n=1 Tax=Fischerella sp. JS2 TaxID=2597771 RepID=UPI0028E37FE4|nr:DUF1501 domain-containing protein [Fischerella sp. JS2]
MNRRDFLFHAGAFSVSTLTAVGTNAWLARSETQNSNQKRLIVIFLRGAIDGLSVVVPYSETAYYQARSKIAIPKPGNEGGVLDLNGHFGLHPALASLMPLWQQKTLAFVHASGSPDPTRSHFDAQDYMESGTPGIKRTTDGWMNRLLRVLSGNSPIKAVSVSATTPRILSGQISVANLDLNRAVTKPSLLDRPQVEAAFEQLYNGHDQLSQTYREGQQARQALKADLNAEMEMANNGAPLPNGFAKTALHLAQLMVKDSRIELGFMQLGGWDTHVNQGGSKGKLARNLAQLGQGLASLVKGLGPVYQHTTVLVMSEFGRTVSENGNGGTDHGHGNVMWVLGGRIRGGKVYGEWPGLGTNQLYQGRDLAITTDFRDVIAVVLEHHMNLNDAKMNQVFSNYIPTNKINLI